MVCSTIWSDADQRKPQSSASLAFVRGIHRRSANSPHKRPVTRKMFPFDDVIMEPHLRWTFHEPTYITGYLYHAVICSRFFLIVTMFYDIFLQMTAQKCKNMYHKSTYILESDNEATQNKAQDYTYLHDDVIKWKHFPHHWPFVRGIHWSQVDSPHKCQWRRVLTFSLICAWTNRSANNRDASDLRRHRAQFDVPEMWTRSRWHG